MAVLALLVVTLVVLSVSVEVLLGSRLRSDLRSRLTDRAVSASVLDGTVPAQQLADRLGGDGVVASVRSGAGQVVVGRPPVMPPPGPRDAAPGSGAKRPRRGGPPAPTPQVEQTGELLTVAQPLADGSTLLLQASLTDVNRTLLRLRLVELLVSGALLVAVALILSRLVGVALAPLDRITATARGIAGGARGARLRPARPDTEIGRTAVAFDEMLDALESAVTTAESSERRMRDFLSDASHELRTPVAGLQVTAETLLRSPHARAEREALALSMVRESRRAGRLIVDLLATARHPRSEPDTDGVAELRGTVDVAEVAREAVTALTLRAPKLNVQLTLDAALGPTPLAAIRGDRLLQVITNLLDNALAATARKVHVRVYAAEGAAALVCLEVSDSGPGVPTADRERIFERFVRLDTARSRNTGGSGLGLAISRAIIREAGGHLTCLPPSSLPGARFVVTLPRTAPEPPT